MPDLVFNTEVTKRIDKKMCIGISDENRKEQYKTSLTERRSYLLGTTEEHSPRRIFGSLYEALCESHLRNGNLLGVIFQKPKLSYLQ